MRRIYKVSLLCLAAGVVGACRPDEEIVTENIPTAGVRFINAVPDTMPFDFRFIDRVESNAHFRIAFRNAPVTTAGVPASTQVQYKNARAGSRQYRIFLNDTIQSVASFVVREGTIDLQAGHNYTFLVSGWADPAGPNRIAGSQPMATQFLDETVADPGAQVALRVLNVTRSAVDVRHYAFGTAVPGAATWAGVAPHTFSAYVNVNPDTILFNVQPAGGGTNLFADTRGLIGVPANSSGARNPTTGVLLPCGGAGQLKCDIEASPGTTIAGSAVTAIIFPGSTACSKAPQASPFQFTTGNTAILTARDGAVTSGFTRPTGSFVTDGIAVGSIIGTCGFVQAANNGLFDVTAVTATTITATKVGGGVTILEAGTTGATTGIMGANPTGYTRVSGSFVTDGFVPGMTINVSGFTQAANNGVSVITAVTPGAITVTKTPATLLEASTTGSIGLAATATGYTRSAGSFLADGFVVGQSVTASGFVNAANNGASTVIAVTAGSLDVSKVGGTVAEAELPLRAIASAAARTAANSTARQIARERPFISFIWDRRPPRPPGM